ncbi:protein kinase, partial [bacterium]
MPELNTTLGNGRFLLTRKLGVGGMGSVYEAADSKRNVSVALKSLGQIDPLAVGSFKAEFRDFQHLHHPNLIVLDEFFNEGDEWYFTMELL